MPNKYTPIQEIYLAIARNNTRLAGSVFKFTGDWYVKTNKFLAKFFTKSKTK